ncbi:hypothetical protein HC891_26605 [Candidatus Gracilibacteria bacterium]|nr:hypothetical protein [Candidatus Gracilibacteria bacterium]
MSMSDVTITITVDKEVAEKYYVASAEERQKIQLLFRLFLQEITISDELTIQNIMDSIGTEAQQRGLTPDILDALLHEDDDA